MQSEKVDKVFTYLTRLYGKDPRCELEYSTAIDLLVAIILSAQCTDKRVNIVTRDLFKKYKTIADYANADIDVFEKEIYSTGFYKNKSKNIIALCKVIETDFGGEIPRDIEILSTMPGIGRKTASVFVAEFHKDPAVAVDTHVIRVANRLGFTESLNPIQIERDLKQIFDRENWARYHFQVVLFGRYMCTAKNPKCATCEIKHYCKNA